MDGHWLTGAGLFFNIVRNSPLLKDKRACINKKQRSIVCKGLTTAEAIIVRERLLFGSEPAGMGILLRSPAKNIVHVLISALIASRSVCNNFKTAVKMLNVHTHDTPSSNR